MKVVSILSSKTSVLVWYSLKQAENEPKTTHVSDLRLSLCENDHFQKRAYSACFQAEYNLYINSGTGNGKRMDRVLLVTLLWCAAGSIAARFQPRSLVDLEAEEASAHNFFFL